MEAQGSHHRSAPVPGSHLRRLQSVDVHAGIRSAGQHAVAAAIHADPARIYRRAIGFGTDARRFYHHALAAPGRILALALQPAVATGLWAGYAFRGIVP